MADTFIVYIVLMLVGIGGTKVIISTNRHSRKKREILMALFLFILAIPIGGRFEVGADWGNYRNLFLNICNEGLSVQEIFNSNYEPIYLLWNYIISCVSDSSSIFFTCSAFVVFFLLYKANREFEYLFPLVLFFFFCCVFGASMNIMRQILSCFIFYLALSYFKKKSKMMALLVAVAILTHYSSVFFIVAFFLGYNCFKILDNPKIVVLIYLSCLLFEPIFHALFLKYLPIEIMTEKYISSINSENKFAFSSGLGIIVTNAINVLIMLTSVNVRSFTPFNNERVGLLYRCFFVGCFLSAFMGNSIFLSRVPFGLTSIKIFLLAYTVYYLSKTHTLFGVMLKTSIVFLYILFFITNIINSNNGCSPYTFKWM